MLKCKYCGEPMELKRFIKEDYQGQPKQERFMWVCDKCKTVLSPKFMVLMDETKEQNDVLRDLYFRMKKEVERDEKA